MNTLQSMPVRQTHLWPLTYTSGSASDPGCVRTLNEDACLDLPERGLWAVADGMGGHHAGALASATVVDLLREVSSVESAFAFRQGVRGALQAANARLQGVSLELLADAVGATVVVLFIHGGHYACIWAGDCRAYRWRDGKLLQLTQDHTLVEEMRREGRIGEADAGRGAHVVTRAVGAAPVLELDFAYGDVRAGDRFLLCSDGLQAVSEDAINRALAEHAPAEAAQMLIQMALQNRAGDNVSAVVAGAGRDQAIRLEPAG